jgi:hypothetical protein
MEHFMRFFESAAKNPSTATVDMQATLLPEIFAHIFALLDFPSCGAISCVSKTFNSLNNTTALWAERERIVRMHCEGLISSEVLPNLFELGYLFRHRLDIEDEKMNSLLSMF